MIKKTPIIDLSIEYQELSDSYDRDEWITVPNIEDEIKISREAARNFLNKDTRINIRISSSDLMRLKQMAAYEGLPYQTLISSVLHKYSSGHLD